MSSEAANHETDRGGNLTKDHLMAEATLQLSHHDEARALFGPRDEYLRRLCRVTGTQVVHRGNQVRIQGPSDEQVGQCHFILSRWQSLLRSNGQLDPGDIDAFLSPASAEENEMISPDSRRTILTETSPEPGARALQELRSGRDKVGQVRPKTDGQRRYIDAMRDHSLVFAEGPAGCGKTYLAVAVALEALRREQVRKIVLVRPAVEAGEKLGFLPGDMFAKVNPYLRPLLDAVHDMLEFEQVRRYMANDVIEIAPLAFMRGRTLNDTFMILDEGQNTTVTQMKMFLTRMGVNSRIVVTGDATQNDLGKGVPSGLLDGIHRLAGIDGVAIIRMTGQDIVRHRLVREIVSAYETTSDET